MFLKCCIFLKGKKNILGKNKFEGIDRCFCKWEKNNCDMCVRRFFMINRGRILEFNYRCLLDKICFMICLGIYG